jgi:hypothetical protein
VGTGAGGTAAQPRDYNGTTLALWGSYSALEREALLKFYERFAQERAPGLHTEVQIYSNAEFMAKLTAALAAPGRVTVPGISYAATAPSWRAADRFFFVAATILNWRAADRSFFVAATARSGRTPCGRGYGPRPLPVSARGGYRPGIPAQAPAGRSRSRA